MLPRLFESERLYASTWKMDDINKIYQLSSDSQVMRHFPFPLDKNQSQTLLNRLIDCYNDSAFTYFPIYTKEEDKFIGFVGMLNQELDGEAYIDIGWRLKPEAWGKGYATEMASRCLEYARELKITDIFSVATKGNVESISVMEKIGMHFTKDFKHPKLANFPDISTCVMYTVSLV